MNELFVSNTKCTVSIHQQTSRCVDTVVYVGLCMMDYDAVRSANRRPPVFDFEIVRWFANSAVSACESPAVRSHEEEDLHQQKNRRILYIGSRDSGLLHHQRE